MLKNVAYLFIVIIALCVIISNFNWKDNNDLQTFKNPHTREMKKSIKEYDPDLTEKRMIDEFIKQMSLDEKIGQLIFSGIRGTTITEESKKLINQYNVGGIILFANNLDNPKQAIQLLNQLKIENVQNPLPLFLGVDQEGGRVERLPDLIKLPTNQVVGDKNNEELSHEVGVLLGKQLNAFGLNLNFSPVLDVNSNPNNPVIGDRSFSNDPEVVSKLGVQTIRGMKSQHIIPVVKHFPGHGDTNVDSHFELPLVDKSLAELRSLELIPFKKAIKSGADVIMTAHILLPQIDDEFPTSMSEKVITGILREELDFDGIVITDDLTMQAIGDNFSISEAAVQSVKAGTDIILMAHDFEGLVAVFDAVKSAMKEGEITKERINESVRRIVQLKWEYGIDNEQVKAIDIEAFNELIGKLVKE